MVVKRMKMERMVVLQAGVSMTVILPGRKLPMLKWMVHMSSHSMETGFVTVFFYDVTMVTFSTTGMLTQSSGAETSVMTL
ncbi:hypothetical protein D3C81_2043160 [compost metagenome]